jgi:hypothetical protein
MAISWLSLARQYEAIERLSQGTGEAALIKGAYYPAESFLATWRTLARLPLVRREPGEGCGPPPSRRSITIARGESHVRTA